MVHFINSLNEIIWGIPLLMLILMSGLYLSIRSGFIQFRLFGAGFRQLIKGLKNEESSGYHALCTALAATVGTGNLAGVAGALAIGGPGVVFWMWICGILGMGIKFFEVLLAVRYREIDSTGEFLGGPMYVIKNAFPYKYQFLAVVYAFFGVVASFGIGNATQINAVIGSVENACRFMSISWHPITKIFLCAAIAIVVFWILSSGSRGVGNLSKILIPLSAGGYVILCLAALLLHYKQLPSAFRDIILGAFTPKAVTGGVLLSFLQTLRVGISRGLFTNEAGMGTASIAHANTNVRDIINQGSLGIIEVFIDTIVICTMTALVILCSGIPVPYGTDTGILLTIQAFTKVFGSWIIPILSIIVCILAFATILGWSLYGGRCMQFLFGTDKWKYYVAAQCLLIVISAILNTGTIWVLSEIFNGLMALPNLIMLIYLAPECMKMIKAYRLK